MALLVAVAVVLTGQRDGPLDFIAYTSLVLGALLAGDTLRARQALQRALAEEAVRASEAAAQHRFDAERLALAHELHDVVGHTLVAINVQAAAAARRARKGGAADGTGALDEIASASAEALAELRTTLKALRSAQDGPAPLHPVQDLAGLGSLIAGVEEAGLAVKLEMAGTPADLPAGRRPRRLPHHPGEPDKRPAPLHGPPGTRPGRGRRSLPPDRGSRRRAAARARCPGGRPRPRGHAGAGRRARRQLRGGPGQRDRLAGPRRDPRWRDPG